MINVLAIVFVLKSFKYIPNKIQNLEEFEKKILAVKLVIVSKNSIP